MDPIKNKGLLSLSVISFSVGVFCSLLLIASPYPLTVLAMSVVLLYSLFRDARRSQLVQDMETDRLRRDLDQANRIGRDLGRKLAKTREQALKWKNVFRLSRNMSPTDVLDDELL